jgi:hypothetical protein
MTLYIAANGSSTECSGYLAIEVGTSLPAGVVVRELEQLKVERGHTTQLRLDNGLELISAKLTYWCETNKHLTFFEVNTILNNYFD